MAWRCPALQQDFSRHVQAHTDREGTEMTLSALWQLYRELYVPHQHAPRQLLDYRTESQADGGLLLWPASRPSTGL